MNKNLFLLQTSMFLRKMVPKNFTEIPCILPQRGRSI